MNRAEDGEGIGVHACSEKRMRAISSAAPSLSEISG